MRKSCTLIPIHRPKFNYALTCLSSFVKYSKNDIYFIFSNQMEFNEFNNLTNIKFGYIILPENLINYRNQITTKKFYGLEYLVKNYEYVGVFDCEVEFIRDFDSDLIYEDIFMLKTLKSNTSDNGGNLIRKCAEFMKLSDNEQLINETQNYTQYWWFNEIPVYETSSFIKFLVWLRTNVNYNTILNEWACFDFLLYSIWLICFNNFTIKNFINNKKFWWGAIESNKDDVVSNEFNSYWDRNFNTTNVKNKLIIHVDNK